MEFDFLCRTALLNGLTPEEITDLMKCLGAERRTYEKNHIVYHAGETAEELGIVLSGGLHIVSNDLWGNTSILDHIGPGQVFAETYACIPKQPLLVDVAAAQESEVLFLQMDCVLKPCTQICAAHTKLIRNLLTVTAEKNLNLSRRIFHTGPKTIRARLLSYLSDLALIQGGSSVAVPYNRQQLAAYLSVDRSALSKELGRMRKDGLLTVEGRTFKLNCLHSDFQAHSGAFWP